MVCWPACEWHRESEVKRSFLRRVQISRSISHCLPLTPKEDSDLLAGVCGEKCPQEVVDKGEEDEAEDNLHLEPDGCHPPRPVPQGDREREVMEEKE